MSVLKAKTKDGGGVTSVQPDSDTDHTVEELKTQGCTDIHDAETGEIYN